MTATAEQVRELQLRLCGLGYPCEADGIWGPVTEAHACDALDALGTGSLLHPAHMLSALMGVEHVPLPACKGFDLADRDAVLELWSGHGLYGQNTDEDLDVRLRLAGLRHHLRSNLRANPDHVVADVAWWLASQRIAETPGRSNRSPWVDRIVSLGAGSPASAPPWCAYSVGAERTIAHWATGDLLQWPEFKTSGGAVRTWAKARDLGAAYRADEFALLDGKWCIGAEPVDLVGAAFARLRTSLSASEIPHTLDRVWGGDGAKGHAGTILACRPDGVLLAAAGNSSGSGHSRGKGGRFTYETITLDPDGDPHAYAAGRRLVGFSTVRRR